MLETLTDLSARPRGRGRRSPARSGGRRGGPLRRVVALAAALALVFLLMLSASHHHHDSIETDACPVCSVSLHQFSAVPDLPLPAPVLVLLPYRLAAALIYCCLYAQARMLPPSCGPPAPARSALA